MLYSPLGTLQNSPSSFSKALTKHFLYCRVLAILLPTALYTSLDRPNDPRSDYLSTDATRADILAMSRGIAIVLILICKTSTLKPEKR